MINHKKNITNIATKAGIELNGSRPWDIQIHNDQVYKKIALYGTLGLGETYMEGWWDCQRMDLLFEKVLRARLETKTHINFSIALMVFGTYVYQYAIHCSIEASRRGALRFG